MSINIYKRYVNFDRFLIKSGMKMDEIFLEFEKRYNKVKRSYRKQFWLPNFNRAGTQGQKTSSDCCGLSSERNSFHSD